MTTVNNRVGLPQASVINGIDAGGAMTAAIQEGFDNTQRSSPDGLGPPVLDKDTQFCRGAVVTQDWIHAVELATGAVGTYVFYERKSGVAAATGYIKHTITNPVIYSIILNFAGVYATCSFNFECKAEDETKTIADMHEMLDGQAAPSYISAARGGWRIISTVLDALSIYHLTGITLTITLPLAKACNDGDVGYTCVDARTDGITAVGSLNFQDSEITAAKLKCQQLLLAATANLVITVRQSQAAANKVITIANVSFLNAGENSGVNTPFTGYSANYEVANDPDTPLTLDGANKIITIEDEA